MYAIVDIKGKQFKVEKDQTVDIPKISDKVGSKVEFDNVLLTNDNGEISTKSSMRIIAEVVSHEVADKVIVFKMKRRKGYQKKNGHKQQYTTIKIQDLKSAKKTAKAKKSTTTKTTTAKKTTAKKKSAENKD
jgi:large subunit ribosomal protein L21